MIFSPKIETEQDPQPIETGPVKLKQNVIGELLDNAPPGAGKTQRKLRQGETKLFLGDHSNGSRTRTVAGQALRSPKAILQLPKAEAAYASRARRRNLAANIVTSEIDRSAKLDALSGTPATELIVAVTLVESKK